MPFKFVANISRLFTERKLIDRFQAARDAGFSFVEITTPLCEIGYSATELAEAQQKAEINVVLINGCTGSFLKKEFGLTALPDKQEAFDADLKLAMEYAKALKAERIHVMAGVKRSDMDLDQMEQTYIKNLQRIATEFKEIGSSCQIEFICPQTIPNYYLNSGTQAVTILKKINHPNLELQLDVFHLQLTEGNLTETIDRYLKFTSYIQVSQAPGRNEPNSPGEINYSYIFSLLTKLGYNGYIGLEYSPSSDTASSFQWMNCYWGGP